MLCKYLFPSKSIFLCGAHESTAFFLDEIKVAFRDSFLFRITDTDTEIGAQIFRTGEIGVAEGNFDLMSKGKLRMSYISQQSDVMNGDLVVTTGLGGYYPSDLVIGSVEDVRPDDSGLVQYAVVVPKADFENLTEVFVIKDFDVVD